MICRESGVSCDRATEAAINQRVRQRDSATGDLPDENIYVCIYNKAGRCLKTKECRVQCEWVHFYFIFSE